LTVPHEGEGNGEDLRNRERSYFKTDAALRDIEDEALDPRRLGRRNDEAGLAVRYPLVFPRSKVFAVPHEPSLHVGIIWQKSCGPVMRGS
jgi:hypothetical protein